jgi:murein DD-endopeptidase MepM/ murein hydrolase activator NlpD
VALSVAELLALAQQAGSGGDPETAAAVAMAESGGRPDAVGVNDDGSRDRGLWQINDRWHPEASDACAFDAACNAQAAYTISNGWTDFAPWTTYRTGAYRQFLQAAQTTSQQAPQRSLAGQQVVGQTLTSPWFPGTWEVTQGWGPTDYSWEPEGHGYPHWHAGVDVGLDCGTVLTLPQQLTATARSMDNPGGYGTALVLLVDGGPGVLLGHLRQRLVDDGQRVIGGASLAVSNNTGNSSGCHLHFEVRPQDAKRPLGLAAYGTDVDPSAWLLSGAGGAQLLASSSSGPGQQIGDAIARAVRGMIAGAQVLLGAGLVVGGLVAASYGARGKDAPALSRDSRRAARRLMAPRPEPRPRAPQRPSEAAASRVRPDLQPAGLPRARVVRERAR